MMGTPPLATAPHYDDDPTTPRPWHRRHWVIVAVLVVVSLAIATATWWGLRSDDNAEPAPPAPAASPPPVSNGQQGYFADTTDRFGQQIRVPRDPAGLALPQVNPKATRGLNDAASGIQWQQIYGRGVAVFTTSDGPTAIGADGLAQGISRTPQGSVIAASQVLGRVFYGPPQVRQKVIAEQIIGPPSAIAMLTDLQLPTRQYPADSFVRVDPQYTDTFSRVSLASGPNLSADSSTGQFYSVTTMTMVWDAGRWKWRIPDDGFSDATRNTRIESVAGWTEW